MSGKVALNSPVSQSAEQENSWLDSLYWMVSDTIVIARRNLLHYIRLPQLMVFAFVQPIMFVLLFAYVFGGAIETPNGKYINYLMPGILTQTVMFGGIQTAIGLAADLSEGLIDRFRSLPMSRAAVLAGRTLADASRNVIMIFVMIGVGYLVGFRLQNDLLPTVGAIVVLILFGYATSWIFACIGILVRDPEATQAAGFIWAFPFVFASSIFVPTETMPRGLRYFAEHQPLSLVVNTVRALILDTPNDDWPMALFWIAAIFAVFATLAINLYRRSTS